MPLERWLVRPGITAAGGGLRGYVVAHGRASDDATNRAEIQSRSPLTSPLGDGLLVDQLLLEKFNDADAKFAVDHLGVNWNAQAAASAASYMKLGGFSCQSMIDQLIFEKFTTDQATYGASTTGLC